MHLSLYTPENYYGIGQCLWLSTKCIKSVYGLLGCSTLLLTARVKLRLNFPELLWICCVQFIRRAVLEGDVSILWLALDLDLVRHLPKGYTVYKSQEIPQGQSVTHLQTY